MVQNGVRQHSMDVSDDDVRIVVLSVCLSVSPSLFMLISESVLEHTDGAVQRRDGGRGSKRARQIGFARPTPSQITALSE